MATHEAELKDSSDSSDVIMSDRGLTVREIANIVGISKFSIQRILTKKLKMLQVREKWVWCLQKDK